MTSQDSFPDPTPQHTLGGLDQPRSPDSRAFPTTVLSSALAIIALLAALLALIVLATGAASAAPRQSNLKAPFTINGDTALTTSENTATFRVSYTVVPDPNPSDMLTWSLGGDDAAHFLIIESQIGQGSFFFTGQFDYETPADSNGNNVYNVIVTVVNDTTSDSGTLPITVEVTNVNEAPTISDGELVYMVDENTPTSEIIATFTASDPDADTVLTWTLAGTDQSDFEMVDGELRFKAVPDFEMPLTPSNSYILQLTVTDDGATPLSDTTAQFEVRVVNLDEDGMVTIEGETSEGKQLTATLTDPDGTIKPNDVEWQWARGSTATGPFTDIGGATSIGSATSSSYTLAADDVAQYIQATVTYRDPQSSTVTKTASAVSGPVAAGNAAPAFDDVDPTTRTVPENSEVGTNVGAAVTASDSEGDTLTYSLSGTDAGSFEIDSSTGQIKTKAGVTYNFEATQNTYSVTMSVHDGKNAAEETDTTIDATIAVTIDLTNVNEAPVFTHDSTISSLFNEDRDAADIAGTYSASDPDADTTFTWTLEGDDGALFTITAISSTKAELMFRSSPDFEMPADANKDNEYKVTVKVTDNGIPSDRLNTRSATHEHSIVVGNVDEPGMVEINGTLSGGEQLMATVTDPDGTPTDRGGDPAGVTWQWKRGDSATGPSSNIGGATMAGYTTVAADVEKYLRATASYYDPESNVNLKSASAVTSGPVEASNAAPAFDDVDPTTRTVPENSEVGTNVGAAVTASDSDSGDTLTYALGGTDAGSFEIDASSGQIKTGTGTYNFEANNTYEVTVSVHDGKDAANYAEDIDSITIDDTITVSIALTNVNEAPVITTDSGDFTAFTVDENTETTTIIQIYRATDVDADTTLTWSLEGTDLGDFTIMNNTDGDGELRFSNEANFEDPADADKMNDYDIRVKVKDNGIPGSRGASDQLDATLNVTVTVQDANDRPVVSGDDGPNFPEIEFDVDGDELTTADLTVPGTYTSDDEDGDDVDWSLSGADAHHFIITADADGNGVLTFKNPTPGTTRKPADYENPVDVENVNDYEVTVEATDDSTLGPRLTGTFPVIVTVTPVNETPAVTAGGAAHSFPEIAYDVLDEDLTAMDYVVSTYTARDEETEAISWSLGGDDMGDFAIDSSSGVLSFRNRPDYEDPADAGETEKDNIYEVTVKAKDTALNTRDYPVTVEVTNVNETPKVTGPADNPSYPETPYDSDEPPEVVATFTARDEEMQNITWSLGGPDEALFIITKDTDGAGVVTFTTVDLPLYKRPDFERPEDMGSDGTYELTVQASDGTNTGTWDYAVEVTGVNETPGFTGTPETTFVLNEHDANESYTTTTLTSYSAHDEEGGVDWTLSGQDGLDFEIDANGVVTFAAAPSFEDRIDADGKSLYTFTVVATEEGSGTSRLFASVEVTVEVLDVEEAGTITVNNLNPALGPDCDSTNLSDPGDDCVVFTLTDPDGGISFDEVDSCTSTERWDLQLRIPNETAWTTTCWDTPLNPTFIYEPHEFHTRRHLRAVATYTDRRGGGKDAESAGTQAVAADPSPNVPPVFRNQAYPSMTEGPAGRLLPYPLEGADRDRDTLTYGIQAGEGDAEHFEVDPATGQVTVVSELDYETGRQTLTFVATLHDGKGVDADNNVVDDDTVDVTLLMTVSVDDVEEAGVVTLSDDEPYIGLLLEATLTDGDGRVDSDRWQWARSPNGSTNWVNISGATTVSYTTVRSDTGSFLRAQVTYMDSRIGVKSAEAITAERVFGDNQPPAFPSSEDGQRTVPENTGSGMSVGAPVAAVDPERNRLTYSLSGQDAAAFSIVTSSGQIRTRAALDFETKPSYSVTVDVHDGRDRTGSTSTTIDASQEVTIMVENVEEPGVVTLTTDTQSIQARVPVTASLEDDDGDITGTDWQWSRSPNGRTGWVNLLGARSATYTPTLEQDAGNYIRATASYTDGLGPNKTANAVSPRVGDPPSVNSAPAFPATEKGQREVAEGTTEYMIVGDPVAANDLNANDFTVNDPLAYSLTGPDADSFTIDAGSGQLSLSRGAELDYEGKRTYRFTVQVTDGRDQNGDYDMDAIDDTINVTVTVTDVNEAPVVTGPEAPSFEENSPSPVATYTGVDPDGDTLTWSVDYNDDFWISNGGELYFRTPPSFEGFDLLPPQVLITATDDDEHNPLFGTLITTVMVTDAEEEGTVVITPPRGWVDEATEFSADLSDGDGSASSISWQWARSPNGRSNWTDIPDDATFASYTVTADDDGQLLRATATYRDKRPGNKTASATLTTPIGDVKPPANTAPFFTDTPPVTRTVPSGTAAGRNVGAPVRATDADEGDVLTYSLESGTDADAFDIDPATGQVLTKAVLDYDPDGMNEYSVTVSVHDGFDDAYNPSTASDTTIDVTIVVTAAPVVSRPTTSGGSSGGSGGGRSRRPAPTPTPTPSPTPTATPTPTGPQFSGVIAAEPSVTATVVPEGTTLGLNGGGDEPGGVYVNFPPTAVALPVHVSVSVSNAAPSDVEAPSGTTLLPLTIDITPETPLTLGEPLTIEINPTPEQLAAAGGDLNHLAVGVVTPNGIVVLPTQVMHGRLVVTIDHLATFVLLAITDPWPHADAAASGRCLVHGTAAAVDAAPEHHLVPGAGDPLQ